MVLVLHFVSFNENSSFDFAHENGCDEYQEFSVMRLSHFCDRKKLEFFEYFFGSLYNIF